MTDKVLYWSSVVMSGLALLLFMMDTGLIGGNRTIQNEITARQNVINSAAQLTPLNQNLAQALAEASIKNGDDDIRDLLTAQGIKVSKADVKPDAKADAASKKK